MTIIYHRTKECDWPYYVLNLECPDCTSSLEVPAEQWTVCPNEDCRTELFVSVMGLVRRPQSQSGATP